jgi:uracil DNA glycosylase
MGWMLPDENSFPLDGEINYPFYPGLLNIFSALKGIARADVRYVILGQDPYPEACGDIPFATGIAFDINEQCLRACPYDKLPPSFREIIKNLASIQAILEYQEKEIGALQAVNAYRQWVIKNNILMLNSALTFSPHQPNAHLSKWKRFIIDIIRQVRDGEQNVVFVAWGAKARDLMCRALDGQRAFVCAGYPYDRQGSHAFSAFWQKGIGQHLRENFVP